MENPNVHVEAAVYAQDTAALSEVITHNCKVIQIMSARIKEMGEAIVKLEKQVELKPKEGEQDAAH